jgi:sugar lactone lactonase YvrE
MTDHARAQDVPSSTPGATPDVADGALTVVATGLAFPRGFTWGPDGALYVSLAGDGLTKPPAPGETMAVPLPDAPPSVVRIENGEAVPVLRGLPSTEDPYGEQMGPVDVGFLGDQLYVLQDATGGVEAVGVERPNGLYAVEPDGSPRLVSSNTVYVTVHPPENIYHLVELGEPFAMVPMGDGFWVVDANRGMVIEVVPDGTQTLIADISLNHPVPTAIAASPDGGVYVGFLGAGPHLDGTSKVIKVRHDGEVDDYWTNLTMITGLAVDTDGTLYALEMSTGNTSEPPNIYPNTGRIVRQTGPSTLDVVATGLDYPISMKFGPDGGLYVSLPAIAPDNTPGAIIRIDPFATDAIAVPAGLVAAANAREGRA